MRVQPVPQREETSDIKRHHHHHDSVEVARLKIMGPVYAARPTPPRLARFCGFGGQLNRLNGHRPNNDPKIPNPIFTLMTAFSHNRSRFNQLLFGYLYQPNSSYMHLNLICRLFGFETSLIAARIGEPPMELSESAAVLVKPSDRREDITSVLQAYRRGPDAVLMSLGTDAPSSPPTSRLARRDGGRPIVQVDDDVQALSKVVRACTERGFIVIPRGGGFSYTRAAIRRRRRTRWWSICGP